MTADLQTAIKQSREIVDLGDGQYTVEGTAYLSGKTIGGIGATIIASEWPPGPRPPKSQPSIAMRGTRPRLTGRVALLGPMPDDGYWTEEREAQHAIESDGAVSPRIDGWTVRNFWGDAVSVSTTSGARDPWTQDFRMWNVNLYNLGRHALTLDAVEGWLFQYSTIGRVSLSPVDCEPPGGSWGAHKGRWSDCIVTDKGHGYVFANKGGGDVSGVTVARVKCTQRPFTALVSEDEGDRRSDYRFIANEGAGVYSGQEPIICRHVDGLTVKGTKQKLGRGTKLVKAIDCTGIDCDVPVNTEPS